MNKKDSPQLSTQDLLDAIQSGDLTKLAQYTADTTKDPHWFNQALDSTGATALHYAIGCSKKDVVDYLLQNGADSEATANVSRIADSCTALHYAAYKNEPEIINLLIAHGANLLAVNANGERPDQIETEYGIRDNFIAQKAKKLRQFIQNKNLEKIKKYNEQNSNWLKLPLDLAKNTALHHAAYSANLDVVQYIVENLATTSTTADILNNTLSHYGSTALLRAAENNTIDVVQYLVGQGAHINASGSTTFDYACNALHAAAYQNNSEIIDFLIENGANVCAKSQFGDYPHDISTKDGSTNLIRTKALALIQHIQNNNLDEIKKYAEANMTWFTLSIDAKGSTMLHHAAIHSTLATFRYIIEQLAQYKKCTCADLLGDIKSNDNVNLLHAAIAARNILVVEYLLAQGTYLEATCTSDSIGENCTALHLAAYHNSVDIIDKLLEAGADISAVNADGKRPSHIATKDGAPNIVQQRAQALAQKALTPKDDAQLQEDPAQDDVPLQQKPTQVKYTILEMVIANDDSDALPKIIEALVPITTPNRDAEVHNLINQPRSDGHSLLSIALEHGAHDVALILIRLGADPARQETHPKLGDYCTPLHQAIYYNQLDIVLDLLEQGADLQAMTSDEKTPAQIRGKGRSAFFHLFKSQNLFEDARSAFITAIKNDDIHTLQTHLQQSTYWATAALDDHGQTALHIAAQHSKNYATIQTLLQHDADLCKVNSKGQRPDELRGPGASLIRRKKRELRHTITQYIPPVSADIHQKMDAYVRESTTWFQLPLTKHGKTAIHIAAEHDQPFLLDIMLQSARTEAGKHALCNQQTATHWTPLHAAVEKNANSACAYLLAHGAKTNVLGRAKPSKEPDHVTLSTPLHFAAYLEQNETVQLLISHGANLVEKNSAGNYAHQIATITDPSTNHKNELERQHQELVVAIQTADTKKIDDYIKTNPTWADVPLPSNNGGTHTVLFAALDYDNVAVFKAIIGSLQQHTDESLQRILFKHEHGHSLIESAIQRGAHKIVHYLLEHEVHPWHDPKRLGENAVDLLHFALAQPPSAAKNYILQDLLAAGVPLKQNQHQKWPWQVTMSDGSDNPLAAKHQALIEAIQTGDVATLKYYAENMQWLQVPLDDALNALNLAARHNQPEVVAYVARTLSLRVEKHGGVAADEHHWLNKLLILAVKHNADHVVSFLLDNGANAELQFASNNTINHRHSLLHLAVFHGHDRTAQALLKHAPQVLSWGFPGQDKTNPLHVHLMTCQPGVSNVLQPKVAALIDAIQAGNLSVVQRYAAENVRWLGMPLNHQKQSALHIAALANQPKILQFILDFDQQCFRHAIETSDLNTVKHYASAKPTWFDTALNDAGETASTIATRCYTDPSVQQENILQLIKKINNKLQDAETEQRYVDRPDAFGFTPLMYFTVQQDWTEPSAEIDVQNDDDTPSAEKSIALSEHLINFNRAYDNAADRQERITLADDFTSLSKTYDDAANRKERIALLDHLIVLSRIYDNVNNDQERIARRKEIRKASDDQFTALALVDATISQFQKFIVQYPIMLQKISAPDFLKKVDAQHLFSLTQACPALVTQCIDAQGEFHNYVNKLTQDPDLNSRAQLQRFGQLFLALPPLQLQKHKAFLLQHMIQLQLTWVNRILIFFSKTYETWIKAKYSDFSKFFETYLPEDDPLQRRMITAQLTHTPDTIAHGADDENESDKSEAQTSVTDPATKFEENAFSAFNNAGTSQQIKQPPAQSAQPKPFPEFDSYDDALQHYQNECAIARDIYSKHEALLPLVQVYLQMGAPSTTYQLALSTHLSDIRQQVQHNEDKQAALQKLEAEVLCAQTALTNEDRAIALYQSIPPAAYVHYIEAQWQLAQIYINRNCATLYTAALYALRTSAAEYLAQQPNDPVVLQRLKDATCLQERLSADYGFAETTVPPPYAEPALMDKEQRITAAWNRIWAAYAKEQEPTEADRHSVGLVDTKAEPHAIDNVIAGSYKFPVSFAPTARHTPASANNSTDYDEDPSEDSEESQDQPEQKEGNKDSEDSEDNDSPPNWARGVFT